MNNNNVNSSNIIGNQITEEAPIITWLFNSSRINSAMTCPAGSIAPDHSTIVTTYRKDLGISNSMQREKPRTIVINHIGTYAVEATFSDVKAQKEFVVIS